MTGYRSGVPDNWFVDPVHLGVPGVRRPSVADEDTALAWQADALCAQTDPEAFFPEKGGSTRDAKRICTRATCAASASSTPCRTTSASASGADSANASAASSSVAPDRGGRFGGVTDHETRGRRPRSAPAPA